MAFNLLQIVQTACDELGLNRPSVVANSTDLQIRQLFALVNRDLRELQQDKDWTAFQREYDLLVSAPQFLTGTLIEGTNVITNVFNNSADFNSDFNNDFYSFGTPGVPANIVANPTLFVINGQYIPSGARIVAADATTITISEYATGSLFRAPLTASQDTYPEPADFDRFINQTWWDRTNRWALIGPDSPQVDQWHRSGIVTIGPRRHFRQIGYNGLTTAGGPLNNYRLWPPPGANNTPIQIAFEYISTTTVLGVNGNTYAPQPYFVADTDIPILDANMMILGAKWRLWQIKGFDYMALQAEWQDYMDRKYGNDGGAKELSLSNRRGGYLISSGNVQDGNYPGPGNP